MIVRKRHILLTLLLLLLGSGMNGAWGKVTYHILTLPFMTYNDDNSARFVSDIRVEALRCTSDELTVGLPEYFKSPLAENFTYYAEADVTVSDNRSQIYQYITTTYDTYTIKPGATPLTPGAAIADNSHVYVTYTYNNATSPIKLDGSVDYNIMLGNRFLCFNKARSNRVGAILTSNVTNENLISTDFTYVTTNGFDNSHDFHFRFWYIGNDPYNITIKTSYVGDGTFRESDKALNKTVTKWYKGSTLFCKGESDGHQNLWMASDDNIQYTQTDASGAVTYVNKPGYYRGGSNGESEMNPIWNSFAILQPDPTQGYIYIGTKINSNGNNWQPDSKNQYFYLTGNRENGKNPRFLLKTPANAEKSKPYTIDTYTYKVTSLLGSVVSVDVEMSNYELSQSVLSYIPDAIRRKYVTFTGAYKTSALDGIADNEMTTFAEAAANGKEIWLKYTSSMPFETLPVGGCYDDARWYTIRMNGDQENQYVAFYDTSNSNCISSGRGSNSDLHQGENSPEAMFAFIGDPFELRIINRKASEAVTEAAGVAETAAHNRYVGCSTNASAPAQFTAISSGYHDKWEIVYENTQMETMLLREMGTATTTPRYIGWNYSAGNKPMFFSETATRVKVVELAQKNYVYHIVRSDGTIAVKATEAQDVGKRLKYVNIPEVIRSPLIDPLQYTGSTVTFYWTKADADASTNARKNASYDADIPNSGDNVHVYVRYTSTNNLSIVNYNVRLNGQYLYYDSDGIKSTTASPGSGTDYQWYLSLSDPYSMKIKNIEADKFLKVDGDWADNKSLLWDTEDCASLFIAKSSTIAGIYEVMAATGDGIDAGGDTPIYYNIGRPEANTVKMYSNSSYAHGYAQLRFLLTPTGATATDYHLIDKANTVLLTVRSMRTDLFFPADYRSPLVETYHYWTTADHNETLAALGSAPVVEGVKQVYVTYDTSSRIDLQRGVMYLLKYEPGTPFRQEDGSDGLTDDPVPPVYPYCNGDCNFFVYGQDEFDLQQQGAASTRTRWAWYLESTNNDPYHVKVCSRQSETYSNAEHHGYFCTYAESWGPTGAKTVVTNLVWPGITGDQPTEYMVLGSVGQYQLVTTETVPVDQNNDGDYEDANESNERQVVKSFEQYWKTFDTIRKKVFGESSAIANQTDPTTVPATPLYAVTTAAGKDDNRKYLSEVKEWHNYQQWAYAKRWNGYNISGAKSKGWEEIEHWYQTVNMGEGYFDFVPITIEPALILLDQHGWEIMRKPLPTSPDDPTKEAKYEAIRPYNSPMVKEYHFWGGAKKRTGFHQYYQLSGQMKNAQGGMYASNDLTKLPDYRNVDGTINATLFDKKGNQLDEYVTYVVKDEYAQSYDPTTGTGAKFLIQQGDNYASTSDGTTISTNAVANPGGMSQTIVTANGSFTDNNLWYLKPNTDIDIEMGYHDADKYPGGYAHSWTNDYASSTAITGFNSNGFDPYNIQITSAAYPAKYFVTNATGAKIDDGEFVGNSSGTTVSLGDKATGVIGVGHDSRSMPITNATFMAVQDEKGNMQLMPRFDNTKRVSSFGSLVVDQIGDAVNLPNTYTLLFRPAVYNYHIIDNSGRESLRYQSGGDLKPQMPEHFQSPLAKDFTFYKTLTSTGANTYNLATLADEITESFAGKSMTNTTNDVYVRYLYDEDADLDYILKGKWFTMQLDEKDAVYSSGIKEGTSKPDPVDGAVANRVWQWKFLETPQTEPDPYAVYLYNRSQAEGTVAIDKRFALLSHTNGDYALAEAGTGAYTYTFLNGSSMTTSNAATTAAETDFKSTSAAFSGTGSQVKLIDDVEHTYNYKVYTNGTNGDNAVKYGVFAISAEQIQAEASQNEFVPILPNAIMTPLLNADQFLYYAKEADMGNTAKELKYLYGMYEDDVYVRYKAYDPTVSGYKVPNEKAIVGSHAARGSKSNDTSLGLSGNLLYNIVWYNDNTMKRSGTSITSQSGLGTTLKPEADYEWKLDGNDPYAIKIMDMSGNYVYNSSGNSCTLSNANATTFMLLSKNEYDYGILQVTGDQNSRKLSGNGNTLATGDPTKYVIFALATHKVIYHLVLANIGSQTAAIPYRANQTMPETPVAWNSSTDTKQWDGTTKRDLTTGGGATYQLGETMTLGGSSKTYCYDAGAISLGAKLTCPSAFSRPNVVYSYVVEGVYSNETCTAPDDDMNNKYKGYVLDQDKMGEDTGLLGKTVLINIVYSFNGDLNTNAGEGFVTNPSQNKWYTVETTTHDGTPWLAQYTNAWGLEMKEGRGTHYTNDYLWSPVGDPYGFQFYNRYIYKNSGDSNAGETDKVMTSTDFSNNQVLAKGSNTDANSVYELLATSNDGYFMIHPVVNKTGTQFYFKTVNETGGSVSVKLGTVPSEFRFGLSKELFDPYFRYVGYIGALKQSVCDDADNKALVEAMASSRELTAAELMEAQTLVYNDDNLEPFAPGYYRLHSPSGIGGISPVRYASGYTHKLELDDAIPMHFYEQEGEETTFELLPKQADGTIGYTSSNATRGDIPIHAVEYDPASIFYITGTADEAVLSTQGLYVAGETGQNVAEGEGVRAKAYMTATAASASPLWIMDIGGGVMLIHDRTAPANRKYLSYHQNDGAKIYDLKLTHNTHTDHAKWCLQPANMLGLRITTHSGGDGDVYGTTYNYTSFYAPFDIMIPDTVFNAGQIDKIYHAVILESANSPWDPDNDDLHPHSIGQYNIAANGCPSKTEVVNGETRELFRTNDRFVPAGTPVLIAMHDDAGYVKVTLPTSSPSSSLTSSASTYGSDGFISYKDDKGKRYNILSGQYLEQKLTDVAATERIFVFGLPYTGTLSLNPATGVVTATLPSQDNTGLGFYLNANLNKEKDASRGSWDRNNWYVLGNKVYYKASGFVGSSRQDTRGVVEFVPVAFNFDDEEQQPGDEQQEDGRQMVGDNRIYDLQGRCVATEEQVRDGSWRYLLPRGIYILNGRKFMK